MKYSSISFNAPSFSSILGKHNSTIFLEAAVSVLHTQVDGNYESK